MIITFCGHSSFHEENDDEQNLLKLIEDVAKDEQVDFYLGGYGNFDLFARKCAKKYQEVHKNAKLIFVTPYLDKAYSKLEYAKDYYDESIYPALENVPKRFAISKRNEWMVSQADHIFAYVCLHFGGAYKTLLYAQKHKKSFTNLYKGEYDLN